MTSKFSRFLNLERSRGERPGAEEPVHLESGNRFETLARGEAPLGTAVPEAHLERFRGEAPLSLEDDPIGEEPRFPRCARCESDNGRFAEMCTSCGADLNTPQQRAYNEQLRHSRQQEVAREHEAAAAVSRRRHDAELRADQERYAVMLAKLRREEQRNNWWLVMSGDGSPGLKLLWLIGDPLVRWSVLALCLLVPLGLWRFGSGTVRAVGGGLFFFVILMLLPRYRRWGR
jgi:hypothetical protein